MITNLSLFENNNTPCYTLKLEIANVQAVQADVDLTWGNIRNKPTTVAGYGITDAYNIEQTDELLGNKQPLLISGQNIKTINNQSILGSGNFDLDLSDYYNKTQVNNMMNTKQNTLVSGTNIKTINNQSILGSGNFDLDLSNYYDKYEVNNLLFNKQDTLISGTNIKTVGGVSILGTGDVAVDCYTREETNLRLDAKQNTLVSGTNIKSLNINNTNVSLLGQGNIELDYYTQWEVDEKLKHYWRKDEPSVINQTETTVEIEPNVLNVWGEVTSLTITFAEVDATKYNEFMIQFVSGSAATTLTLPSSVEWLTDADIEPNTTYQISIVNNLGIMEGWQ
jgi:hypothetical protein